GGLVFEPGVEVDEVFFGDNRVGKDGGSGSGGALAKAIPVIGQFNAGLVAVDRGDYPLAGIRALGVGVQPVGEDRAGGIVLGAVDPESALAIGTDLGDHLPHLHCAYLG